MTQDALTASDTCFDNVLHAHSDCVLVGMNSNGNWIVRDLSSRHGGLFISRSAALRYARSEFGHLALPIFVTGDNLALDISSG